MKREISEIEAKRVEQHQEMTDDQVFNNHDDIGHDYDDNYVHDVHDHDDHDHEDDNDDNDKSRVSNWPR